VTEIRAVLADDSEVVRARIAFGLGELPGVRVVAETADSGAALEAIERLHPDVVVLDVLMPGGGAIRVLDALAQSEPRPVTIVFTNFPYPEYRDACRALGADYFFDKSSEFDRLVDVIRRLAEKAAPH
jgi:two-component system response regulator DevR